MGYETNCKEKIVGGGYGYGVERKAPGITLPHERMTSEQRKAYADFIPVKRVVIAK